jgi:ethanolamine ammonia-lyase small subunit
MSPLASGPAGAARPLAAPPDQAEPGRQPALPRPPAIAEIPAQSASVTAMPWGAWRSATPARIALGRAGVAIPTDEALRFGCAHAMARDAIHTALDVATLTAQLEQAGHLVLLTHSRAAERTTYLRRPDLGRQLDPADWARLRALAAKQAQAPDLCLVIGDGLSSLAVQRHAVPLLAALMPLLPAGTHLAPLVLVQQARVAVADDVGEALQARLGVILIGERPGLSSPDSLGVYLTHGPQRGRVDAQRNCISNVRPEGLSYAAAAHKLAWLIGQSHRLGHSGVALKDESGEVAQLSAAHRLAAS